MKLKFQKIDSKWKAYALAGCISMLFLACIMNLGKIWGVIAGFLSVLKPVFLGCVIAYIMNLLAVMLNDHIFKFIRKLSVRWKISVIVTIFIVLALLTLLLASLIPQIVDNVVSLAENYQYYLDSLRDFIEGLSGPMLNLSFMTDLMDSFSQENGLFSQIGALLTRNSETIIETTTEIGSAALNWLIGGIFAIYFLFAKKGIAKASKKMFSLMLSPVRFEGMTIILEKFNLIFSKYIVCELVDSLIVGVASYIFMIIFRMPDALFISVIVGVTNLVPTFGPVFGAAIGGFILLLVKPSSVVPFLIFMLVSQIADGYVIKPKLFGNALNVPGALILVAIVVFGKLMGVVGMLIAIPAAAIIVYIYKEVFLPWIELKRELEALIAEQDGE